MEMVSVKNKFQVVIPQHVREQVHIEVGDILEVKAEGGKITLTPQTIIDRHLTQALDDVQNGRTHGPYTTASDAIAALKARTKRQKLQNPRSRAKQRT